MSECPRKSVGAFIEKVEDGVLKILLIDRVNEPHGWAGVAGHLDEGKTPEGMILIEIGEEVGLQGFEESLPFTRKWFRGIIAGGIRQTATIGIYSN